MNEHEAGRIAAAMNQMRPDWPTRQLLTLLRDPRIADRPRRDVAVALAWVACDPSSANPYRVLESGPWWIAVAVDGQTTGRREPFDHESTCDICGRGQTRHANLDHLFVSVLDHTRKLAATAEADADAKAKAREYARQALGDAKAEKEPAPEKPAAPPNPNVDRLRQAAHDTTTATTDTGRAYPTCAEHGERESA